MKKRKPEWKSRVGASPKNSIILSNELRLRQIYNSGMSGQHRSPRNYDSSGKRQNAGGRYQLPLTDRKGDTSQQKNNKYQAYLESQIMKIKPSHRYNKPLEKEQIPSERQKERLQNESVDMFKIRKKKMTPNKVSASSHIKLNEESSQFQEGKQLYKRKQYNEALALFQACLQEQPNHPDYLYYAAIIHLNKHNYQKALPMLQKICHKHPEHKKTIFLFAAISAKNVGELEKGEQLCSMGLEHYAQYVDLIMYRGKLRELLRKYQEAHEDFEKVLRFDKNNMEALMKNANCLRKVRAFANCLSNLAAALYIDKGEHRKQLLLERIQILLEIDNIKQARKDVNKLLQLNNEASEGYLYRGIILLKEGSKKEAILSFEQCLKLASSREAMCQALIQITKTKIENRDFYSAYYHINRSKHLNITCQEIQIYHYFTEGVVYLMKRKIQEGDANFTYLLDKHPLLTPYLTRIFYLYRAFGKFMLSQFEQCIHDYQLAHQYIPLDLNAQYNKLLAEGIIKAQAKDYPSALELFTMADKVITPAGLNKTEPYLYRGGVHVQYAKDCIESRNQIEDLKALEEIFNGLKQLDKAYDINDSNSNILYYRGLVYLYLGKYQEAQQDIMKAISKSEENVPKYFFFRGLSHASLNNRKQALNDFNICTNLDEKYSAAYLERAKIHFANNNTGKGLEDLAKLAQVAPQEDTKFHECCLDFLYAHYTLAAACIPFIQDPQKQKMMRIFTALRVGEVVEAEELLESEADKMICHILLGKDVEEVASSSLEYFTIYHYYNFLGVREFRNQNYQKALDYFTMAVKERNLYDLEQGIANNNLNSEEDEDEEEQDDQADIVHKINYNIFVTYMMAGDHKKGYEIFYKDVYTAKESLMKNQYMGSFSHLLIQALKGEFARPTQEKEIYQLSLYQSKIDELLQEVVIELPNIILKTKLCLINVTTPQLKKLYQPRCNPDFILSFMKLSQIENRPQPPWVKRKQEGLIFTDDIQPINIEFQTTQNDEESEQDDEEQEDEDEEADDEEDQEGEAEKMSVGQFKMKMKLDDSIQRKLQRIMEKKQP